MGTTWQRSRPILYMRNSRRGGGPARCRYHISRFETRYVIAPALYGVTRLNGERQSLSQKTSCSEPMDTSRKHWVDIKIRSLLAESNHISSLADFGLAAEFPASKGPLAAAPSWMTGSSQSTTSSGLSAEPLNSGRDQATSFVGTAEYLVRLRTTGLDLWVV